MNSAAALENDSDLGVTQRVVTATDGSPLHTAAASSVFNWRGPGTARAEPQAEQPTDEPAAQAAAVAAAPITPPTHPEEETTMVTKKRNGAARARNSTRGSPQLEICTTLQAGDLTREQIPEALPHLEPAQISSALNNAKKLGRVVFIEKSQVYRLTAEGKAWLKAAGGEEPAEVAAEPKKRAARKSAAHRRGRRARTEPAAEELDTPPTEEVKKTFRCAVMSDGCFFLTKDGVTIELEPDEHAQMLHYLERMAEPEAVA